jgi:hypothetical protein
MSTGSLVPVVSPSGLRQSKSDQGSSLEGAGSVSSHLPMSSILSPATPWHFISATGKSVKDNGTVAKRVIYLGTIHRLGAARRPETRAVRVWLQAA